MRAAVVLGFSVLSLGACSKADNEPGPGGVTVGEARALDEAAAMLDQRRPPAEALEPSQTLAPRPDPSRQGEDGAVR